MNKHIDPRTGAGPETSMLHSFREFVPAPTDPRVCGITEHDVYQHTASRMARPLANNSLFLRLQVNVTQPFVGITANKEIVPELFHIADEGAPVAAMVEAANALLATVSAQDSARMRHHIDSPHWRFWMNPEVYVCKHGLRLDEVGEDVRDAVLGVLEASMSPKGYRKARDCMRMNHFLGQVVKAPKVMNEYSYNFQLFGDPSADKPWGWNFWGHHLCINCFVLGHQIVMSPVFMGAEPNVIDEGPWKGLTIFNAQEAMGLSLMQSLPQAQKNKAQIYKHMKGPDIPEWRFHPADQQHLGGAFTDNRVIPYEGIAASELTTEQQNAIIEIAEEFLCYLPEGSLQARLAEIRREMPRTCFAWIGGYGDDDPFYYKIQSPVVILEFDHHSGVFLTNKDARKFHAHTIVRIPNGNDYGREILRQYYAKLSPPRTPGPMTCAPDYPLGSTRPIW